MTRTKTMSFNEIREALGLSQERAARLLGVTLQTAYRWDNGKTDAPAEMMVLLPMMVANKAPSWCKVAEKEGLSPAFLAGHIPGCDECKLSLAYLNVKLR
jgi:DNA-binding XRE family transcriptional regulator